MTQSNATTPAVYLPAAFPCFAVIIVLFVPRLPHEGKMLRRELPGQADYCQRMR